MFWKKDNTEKKISQMNDLLKKSFENVKRDTTGIFQWMNYFYRRGMEQEQLIKRLQLELSYMPKTREDVRRIIDEYYSFEGMLGKIRDINFKLDDLARAQAQKQEPIPQPQQAHHQEEYVQKYGINNLWKYDLPRGWRLLYTVTADNEVELISAILEWFDHKDYERKFGY